MFIRNYIASFKRGAPKVSSVGLCGFEVRKSSHGLGVFAQRPLKAGEYILDYAGAIQSGTTAAEVDALDHCLQIGPQLFLGPSGEADDYVNHSCDPNSAVIITGTKAQLIALRDIQPGEEITNDYSMTVDDETWNIQCDCGAKTCRQKIQSFKYLPKEVQQRCRELGIVPEYILNNTTVPIDNR